MKSWATPRGSNWSAFVQGGTVGADVDKPETSCSRHLRERQSCSDFRDRTCLRPTALRRRRPATESRRRYIAECTSPVKRPSRRIHARERTRAALSGFEPPPCTLRRTRSARSQRRLGRVAVRRLRARARDRDRHDRDGGTDHEAEREVSHRAATSAHAVDRLAAASDRPASRASRAPSRERDTALT